MREGIDQPGAMAVGEFLGGQRRQPWQPFQLCLGEGDRGGVVGVGDEGVGQIGHAVLR